MSSLIVATTYESVLKFWFPEGSFNDKLKLWFKGGKEIDDLIKDKFGSLVLQARNGDLAHWEDLSQGTEAGLAFIILLDQFCRNIYRGTPDQFSHDDKALSVALKIIESGKHNDLEYVQRSFLYLPLEHCECLDTQDQCVQLFSELDTEATAAGSEDTALTKATLKFAEEHRTVIRQFGRFPGRNAAIGRENTLAEIEFLKDNPYIF